MTRTADSGVEAAGTAVGRVQTAWYNHDLEAAVAMISEDGMFEVASPAPDGGPLHHQGRDAGPVDAELSTSRSRSFSPKAI